MRPGLKWAAAAAAVLAALGLVFVGLVDLVEAYDPEGFEPRAEGPY